MNIGIQTALCRINLMSLSIMVKKYNLGSQVYHLKFKKHAASSESSSFRFNKKIKNMFALITHTSHVAEPF